MSNHAWCSDPARDDAVRAAEDNRQGPPPTLEECIDTARAMMPKSVSSTSEVNALRARVAELEAAAKLAPGANACGEANCLGSLIGSQEPVAWGVMFRANGLCFNHYTERFEADLVRNHINTGQTDYADCDVAPLYAAPQPPRGWLTAEERESVEILLDAIAPSGGNIYRDEIATLTALLARSTPPRVMVPKYFPMSWAHERDDAWIAAIREAGGEVE